MTDIGKIYEWFEEKLHIRNGIEVNIGDYFAYYYEQTVLGELVGNISIYKDAEMILHTITKHTITAKKELKQMLENYLSVYIKEE